MKKLFLLGLAASMLTFAPSVYPTAQAQGPAVVSSVLNRMERNGRSISSLRANVVLQKYNAQLKESDTSFGEVYYVPGKGRNPSVRLNIQRPRNEVLAVKGGEYVLFKPRLNMAYKGSTNSKNSKASGVLGFGFNATSAELKANYDVQFVGEGSLDGPHVVMLKFVPKGKADFKFAEVWVDDNGMPLQTRVTERNGDSTLVRLQNVQKNAKFSGDVFNVQLPSGVKIVKG